MIEVEKKFEPTEEQIKKITKDAIFIGELKNHDIYYDYTDFSLFQKSWKLRNRNGKFELKMSIGKGAEKEVEDDEEIKKFLGISEDLASFVSSQLTPFIDFVNNRKKYKKDGFNIDIDETNFGMNSCDVEILVENENEIEGAKKKIEDFAKEHNLKDESGLSKRANYLKTFNPDLFQKLYGNK